MYLFLENLLFLNQIMSRIILLSDDPYQRNLFTAYLKRKLYEVETVVSINAWNQFYAPEDCIILSQCSWPKMTTPELVHFIMKKTNAPIIIFTSDINNLKQAVSTIKAGAVDYLLIPIIPEDLLSAVRGAFNQQGLVGTELTIKANRQSSPIGLLTLNNMYVGTNVNFQKALQQVKLVAQTTYSVIIYGESGTGKEIIAKLIHEQSNRRAKPFIAIDCGSLTEELANSELFGHEKGAFTGAHQLKIGCLEQAQGGTVFLDEIANLSYSIQVSLLRVLQERTIKRIGSSSDIPIDVRIIVASNEHLKAKVESGLFRNDLYYRLNEFYIELPALRDRKDEIPNMVSHFINNSNKELGKIITGCSTGVLNTLLDYDFPGNLRELKNIIRRSCLVASETIMITDLPSNLINSIQNEPILQEAAIVESVLVTGIKPIYALKDVLQLKEFELIVKTMREHKYNKSKVARLLNIDRKTLYNKLAIFESKNLKME